MRTIIYLGVAIILGACSATDRHNDAGKPSDLRVTVHNSGQKPMDDALVVIESWQELLAGTNMQKSGDFVGMADSSPIPVDEIDRDNDGLFEAIAFVVSLGPGEKTIIQIKQADESTATSMTKRTHAELSVKEGGEWKDRVYQGGTFKAVKHLDVPPEHTDHSFYIRYEGPGWESEKIGYRFYLDWRNAIDIFGKRRYALVLDKVGLDGFDSYHEMSDWGMDILKVGDALGLGSLGYWSNGHVTRMSKTDSVSCSITSDGNIYSEVQTQYYGWATGDGKADVTSRLSIGAGSRLTRHEVLMSGSVDSVCTGIVKHNGTEVIKDLEGPGWCYLATWGDQSLSEDALGMALFFRKSDLLMVTEDDLNHTVIFNKQPEREFTYCFAAFWEQEPGIKGARKDFTKYLEHELYALNNPVQHSLE